MSTPDDHAAQEGMLVEHLGPTINVALTRAKNGNGKRVDPLTAERTIELAKQDSAFLLQPLCMVWAQTLDDLSLARLEKGLVDAGVSGAYKWARLVARKSREHRVEQARAGRSRQIESEPWRANLLEKRGQVCESVGNLCILLRNLWAGRLTYDEMAGVPHLDGKPFTDADITGVRCQLEASEGLEFGEAMTLQAVTAIAWEARFHPVQKYLSELVWDGTKRLDQVASEYLGATDKLSAKLVARTMIAGVARAMKPGKKVDTCLILVGDEGFKKSTFFRVLARAWFSDSKCDITDRKGMMQLHSAWIYEWPEVEKMLARHNESEVKAFVSQQDDSFVPMFGRAVKKMLRSSIVVGTTNRSQYIVSSTGSRRWWTVTVTKKVDDVKLVHAVDQLWAEAVHCYREFLRLQTKGTAGDENPYRWWLNDDEELERERRNEDHHVASPDEELVSGWLAGKETDCQHCHGTGGSGYTCSLCEGHGKLEPAKFHVDKDGREYVTCRDVLHALGVKREDHERNATRATNVLLRIGWKAGARIRTGEARVTPYYMPHEVAERRAIQQDGQP